VVSLATLLAMFAVATGKSLRAPGLTESPFIPSPPGRCRPS
jgi:hypothetical protein